MFDAIGCGYSDGEYITLGVNEQHDLKPIIEYLKNTKRVSQIILYGWSMGAATVLLYVARAPDPLVSGIVVDSPFAKFSELFKQLAKSVHVPDFFTKGFYDFARKTVEELYGFDLEKLNPTDGLEKAKTPAIFVHATNDKLIPINHSEMVYAKYGGPKEKLWFFVDYNEDAHNAPRMPAVKDAIMAFMKKVCSS